MKKKITGVILLYCLAIVGHSQNLTMGLKIGSNTSKLVNFQIKSLDPIIDYLPTNNFNYGIFFNYNFKNKFSIQPEINYILKGIEYNMNPDIVGGGASGKAKMEYLEIPILVKYNYGDKFKGFINMGTSINLIIDGGNYNYHRFNDAIPESYEYYRNIKSDFNKFTIGIVGGVGLSYCILKSIELSVEFRYNYLLSNSANNNEYIDPNTGDVWNYDQSHFIDKSLNFGIAYKFGHK